MARIVYSSDALRDLERLVEFLLQASPETAVDSLDRIRGAITILSRHPRIGRRVREPLRELVITQGATGYLALYRFEQRLDLVRVLRIRHQREAGYLD